MLRGAYDPGLWTVKFGKYERIISKKGRVAADGMGY
jgi:hypothetical protein